MTLTFVCQACEDSFEVEHSSLSDESTRLKCPGCGKRFPSAEADELATTLDELLSQVLALRKRFAISFEVNAEDLGSPLDLGKKKASHDEDEDDEEDEDEDDEDNLDDDELEEDDDDRF